MSRNNEGATAAGRLFGRTVFEGIVADLPFANFMLAKLLHGHAFRDDLQSLDAESRAGTTERITYRLRLRTFR